MILGTANFNWKYNDSFVEKNDCFEIMDYYFSNGGEIIDTAFNYHCSDIISEWMKVNSRKIKINTKVWKKEELEKSMNQLGIDKIYCVYARDSKNEDLLDYLFDMKSKGFIEKVGVSIYYENELTQRCNSLHIPACDHFVKYFPTMLLHSDIVIRSMYNQIQTDEDRIDFMEKIKKYSRPDLNHTVDFCVGVDTIDQLKENLEIFKKIDF
jgi:hypothetical protein